MRKLVGKVAVVTGAGSGIGRATALALSRAGTVVAVADIDEAGAKETSALCAPGASSSHVVDMSCADAVRVLADEVLSRHDVVDIVVNNAGIGMAPQTAERVPLDTHRRLLEVNYWGVVHGSLCFLPHLTARPEANLVNVASNAGLMAQARFAPYSASKFAVRGFSDALRMELRRTSVTVSVVYPGLTATAIMTNSPVIEDEAQRARLQQQFAGGFVRTPESVASAIVKAIRHDRPRAVVGADSAVIDRIARYLPARHGRLLGPGIDRYLDKLAGDD